MCLFFEGTLDDYRVFQLSCYLTGSLIKLLVVGVIGIVEGASSALGEHVHVWVHHFEQGFLVVLGHVFLHGG